MPTLQLFVQQSLDAFSCFLPSFLLRSFLPTATHYFHHLQHLNPSTLFETCRLTSLQLIQLLSNDKVTANKHTHTQRHTPDSVSCLCTDAKVSIATRNFAHCAQKGNALNLKDKKTTECRGNFLIHRLVMMLIEFML